MSWRLNSKVLHQVQAAHCSPYRYASDLPLGGMGDASTQVLHSRLLQEGSPMPVSFGSALAWQLRWKFFDLFFNKSAQTQSCVQQDVGFLVCLVITGTP